MTTNPALLPCPYSQVCPYMARDADRLAVHVRKFHEDEKRKAKREALLKNKEAPIE